MVHELDTCPTCGVEHASVGGELEECPYGTKETCPVCGEASCICDILEEFPLGPDGPLPDLDQGDYQGQVWA